MVVNGLPLKQCKGRYSSQDQLYETQSPLLILGGFSFMAFHGILKAYSSETIAMQLSSPIDAVSSSVHHAALVALPEIPHRIRDFKATEAWTQQQHMDAMRNNTIPYIETTRRPQHPECEVIAMFAQTWGSTSLGYGGIGGAAMTPAYTVAVQGPDGSVAVYWAGRFAYLVPHAIDEAQRQAFREDLAKGLTVRRRDAVQRYGAVFEERA